MSFWTVFIHDTLWGLNPGWVNPEWVLVVVLVVLVVVLVVLAVVS